jgi:hypothetical protein
MKKREFSKTESLIGMISLSIAMFALDADNFRIATVFGIVGIVVTISVMLDISANKITKNSKPNEKENCN